MAKKTTNMPVFSPEPRPDLGKPSATSWEGAAPFEDMGAQGSEVETDKGKIEATMQRFANQGLTHSLDGYCERPDPEGKGW